MAMNFFMVSLLGFFHRSTSAAEEKRVGLMVIPEEIIYFQIFNSSFRQSRRSHPKRRSERSKAV
jgi:hypothetical protein